jgi:Ca2+-binding RTX toxin-like protein
MPQPHVFWGGRETAGRGDRQRRNLRLVRGGSMRQLRLRVGIAGALAAAMAMGSSAVLPAGAGPAQGDGSVTIAKVQRGYDVHVAGESALVLNQRGKTLEMASASPFSLPSSCKERRHSGQWFVAACDVVFGHLITMTFDGPTKLGANTRDLILDLHGSAGDDEMTVKSLVAKVDGGAGNDTLIVDGGYGAQVNGGEGDDTITVFCTPIQGMSSSPSVDGGPGNDTITGSDRADHLNGGADNDTIEAGDGNDIVAGNAGDDVIDGGRDADKIQGDSFVSDPSTRPDPGLDTLYYGRVRGAWSVTQDSDQNDGSNVDKFYWDVAHENFYMDEVHGFEDVVKGPIGSRAD